MYSITAIITIIIITAIIIIYPIDCRHCPFPCWIVHCLSISSSSSISTSTTATYSTSAVTVPITIIDSPPTAATLYLGCH